MVTESCKVFYSLKDDDLVMEHFGAGRKITKMYL